MTDSELALVLDALATLASRRWPTARLRQIVLDDALGCERCRRSYAALVLWHADHPDARGRIELSEADYAVTGALAHPHTCARRCGGGVPIGVRCRTTAKACAARRNLADRQLWWTNQAPPPNDAVTREKRRRRERQSTRR